MGLVWICSAQSQLLPAKGGRKVFDAIFFPKSFGLTSPLVPRIYNQVLLHDIIQHSCAQYRELNYYPLMRPTSYPLESDNPNPLPSVNGRNEAIRQVVTFRQRKMDEPTNRLIELITSIGGPSSIYKDLPSVQREIVEKRDLDSATTWRHFIDFKAVRQLEPSPYTIRVYSNSIYPQPQQHTIEVNISKALKENDEEWFSKVKTSMGLHMEQLKIKIKEEKDLETRIIYTLEYEYRRLAA